MKLLTCLQFQVLDTSENIYLLLSVCSGSNTAMMMKDQMIKHYDYTTVYPTQYQTYPFYGPRFLNSIDMNDFEIEKKISSERMIDYYTCILGSNISSFGITKDFDFLKKKEDLCLPGFVDEYSLDDVFFGEDHYYKHKQPGYIEHRPQQHWCAKSKAYGFTTYLVRNEIDCVGFIGMDVLNTKYPKTLMEKCAFRMNILPSLFAPQVRNQKRQSVKSAETTNSQYNYLVLQGQIHDVVIEISDYDAISLATKTGLYNGIEHLVGREGIILYANNPPSIDEMERFDGYRFWYWMYNHHLENIPVQRYDQFFTGLGLAQRRKEKIDQETYNLHRLFNPLERDVTLQGAGMSTAVAWANLPHDVAPIAEISRRALRAQAQFSELAQQPWFTTLTDFIMGFSSQIAAIATDLKDFVRNPMDFIKNLNVSNNETIREYMRMLDGSSPFGIIDYVKSGLIIAAGAWLYDTSPLMGAGLLLVGNYYLLDSTFICKRTRRAVSLVMTLMSIAVGEAIKLRTASVSLQSTNNLASVVYAACTFFTLSLAGAGVNHTQSSVMAYLTKNTKDIFNLARGSLSLAKCAEYIIETLQLCIEYVFGSNFLYNSIVKCSITSKELQEYVQYCLTTQPEDLAAKLTLSLDARKEWSKICALHHEFIRIFSSGKPLTETHIGFSMYSRACTAFGKLKLEYDKIRDSLNHFRPEPFIIWVFGEPGTGKTWIRDLFVNNLCKMHAAIDPTLPDVRQTGLLYVRNPADKYMSKYRGEFAIAYDDVGQNRQQDNPEFNEIMGFGSTNQVKLNMADLEDKGRLFSSKVIILAANSKNVVSNNLILREEAFNRRRHLVVEMKRPTKESDDLTTSKSDFSKVQLILSDPINGATIKSFPEDGFGDNDAIFKEFFEWVKPKYVKHVKTQQELLEKKEQSLFNLLNNQPDEQIVNVEDFADANEELPPLDPVLDYQQHTMVRVARLMETDENFKLLMEGVANCFADGMDKPTPFLRNEIDRVLREYKIRPLTDVEYKFFKKGGREDAMTGLELKELENLWVTHANDIEVRFPWMRVLKFLGYGAGLFGLYKIGKSLFFGNAKEIFSTNLQSYSDITKAAKTTPVVIQENLVNPDFPVTIDVESNQFASEEEAMKFMKDKLKSFQKYAKWFRDEPRSIRECVDYLQGLGLIHDPKRVGIQSKEEEALEWITDKYERLKRFNKFVTEAERTELEMKEKLVELQLIPNPKISTQQYTQEIKAQPTPKVFIQDSQKLLDFEIPLSNVDMINHHISNAMGKFTKLNPEGSFVSVNGFNVCYNAWLIPRHFLPRGLNDTQVKLEQNGRRPVILNIAKKNVTTYKVYDEENNLREKDMCVVHFPELNHGKNLVKHFATRQQLARVKTFTGKIVRWNPQRKMTEEAAVGLVNRWDKPMLIDTDGATLCYSSGYTYNFATDFGDCGALLISIDNSTSSRIFGVHFGINNIEKKGLSYHIAREDLSELIEFATPKVDKIEAVDPIVEIQQSKCPETLKDAQGVEFFEYLGTVKDAPLPPKVHKDLFRSPMYDEVYPAEKDLSVLSQFDVRLDDDHFGNPDIVTRGVIDFAYESKPWPRLELEIAQEALMNEFDKFKDPLNKRLLTMDEAINGVWEEGKRLEYSEPLNLKTSAGYGLSGVKADHFDTKHVLENDKLVKVESTIKTRKLQEQVDEMWNEWLNGKTYPLPWSHTVKMEAIKLSKIKTGNSRTFCVASTAFLINVRRLFGAFTTAMKSSKVKSFSCLGVDANSQDWFDLYCDLVQTGKMGADMDFFKFDRTAVTWQLARAVCDMINRWYDDGEVNARARLIAFEDMIYAYGLINKDLTRKARGNPSGNPLTTELNNCVNYLMMCMVYLLIAKVKSPADYSILKWKQHINMKAYGDDIIFTISPAAEMWFDFDMLSAIYAEYGVPVTPADKSDDGIKLRPVEELTFLKRNFRPFDHHFIKWQSALSQTSIKNMIQFYRLKPNNGTMMEAVMENCNNSLDEAYHWGEEFFNEHKQRINNWLKEHDYTPIPTTFTELDVVFRHKLGG